MSRRSPDILGGVRRVTLEDVAAAAGVSRQTVSNVVNGTGRLSEETRANVNGAISALGYHPHRGARGLKSRRTMILAYPTPSEHFAPENSVMVEWVGTLVASASERGYDVLLTANDSPEAIDSLAHSGTVDGFILSAVHRRDPRAQVLARRGVPFSCFGRLDRPLPQTWVDIDNHAGMRAVVEHLVVRGHRRIGFVGLASERRWDRLREAGFRAGLANAGLEVDTEQVVLVDRVRAGVAESLLARRNRPTAVVASSDMLAASVFATAAARHIAVGANADLAVTGFDGSAVGEALTPSLTTVVMPLRAIADAVIDSVLQEVEGRADRQGQVIETPLTVGDSA